MPELNLVLLGPPGSGKGTQGERLNADLHLPYYATGDILRGAVRDETELGKSAKAFMDAGDLGPDELIGGVGGGVRWGVLVAASGDEVTRRLGGRRTCEAEGHVYHVEFNPPKVEGVCDVDGSPLVVRDDDKPDVIRKRLPTHHQKTEPLAAFYY